MHASPTPPLALDWPVEALRAATAERQPDLHVEVLAEAESTNTLLMRRARDGTGRAQLLVAERQTAGRGRLGRDWLSDATPGGALTFSLGLPLAPRDWSGLSLVAGVAVASSLHPDIGLKWPNDLWWHDRKLAGILIETASRPDGGRQVVIGVGLNVAPLADAGFGTAPAWLRQLRPELDAPAALAAVAAPLLHAVLAFEREGFAPWRSAFAARDVLAGRAVRLSDGTEGTALGVDADGALRVRLTDGSLRTVTSAEVSVRPAPADAEGRP